MFEMPTPEPADVDPQRASAQPERAAVRVANWHQFQHYRDRNPPWIKLHFALLSSRAWVMLDDASRVLAIACMLVASRNDGVIHSDEAGLDYLRRVAYLNRKPNIKPLIENGFLECASGNASAVLANARPETETYKEETTSPERKATAPPANSMEAETAAEAEVIPLFDQNDVDGANDRTAIESIPVEGGGEYLVRPDFLHELDHCFPGVDPAQTLREIRAWCIANPARQKTIRGVRNFIVGWFRREQERAAKAVA